MMSIRSPASRILLILSWLLSLSYRLDGGTIHAASAARLDVGAAVALAKEGDTVIVPAGTANWTSKLSISKGITLQGATTIIGAGTKTPTANDLTVIKNDFGDNLIEVSISAAQSFRITGLTIQANLSGGTHLHLSSTGGGPVRNMRVDHNHLVGFTNRGVILDGWVYGVADHNYIQSKFNGQCFLIQMATYGGKLQGHGAFADYPWFGTGNFWFIEDNTMTGQGSDSTNGAIDSEKGGRFVVRQNYFINCRPGWHGTEGADRGCRAVEVYNNTFDWSIPFSALNRSGVAFYHDNKWVNKGSSTNCHSTIQIYRGFGGTSVNINVGMADGTGPFDMNATEPDGSFVEGHPQHLFGSGTVTSAGTGTLTDSTKSWAPNQWVGYSVKQVNPSAPSSPKGGWIKSNTATTITYCYYGSGDRGPTLAFAAGDRYEIHKVIAPLDAVGRGRGDLLSGGGQRTVNGQSVIDPVVNTVTGFQYNPMTYVATGKVYAHAALEPAMSWNNVYVPTNTAYGFGANEPYELQGRDYFNLGKGFPANTTPPQVSGIYTAALNGTNYTGPYTYPHPLVSGGSPGPTPTPSPTPTATPNPTPNPPTDLRVVPGP